MNFRQRFLGRSNIGDGGYSGISHQSQHPLKRGLLWTGVVFGHDAVKLPRFMTRNVISLPHGRKFQLLCLVMVNVSSGRSGARLHHIRVGSPVGLTPVVAPKLRGWVDFSDFRHRWFPEGRSDAL